MRNASSAVGRRHLVRAGLSGGVSLILLASLIGPAAVLAAVGSPPTPQNDVITMDENGTPATGNVLANDTDPDLDPLTVSSYVGVTPTYGTLTVETNGDYTFTPAVNWHGDATAWYYVTDGVYNVLAYITIHVYWVNAAPVAVDDEIAATEDTPDTFAASTLAANDTDIDGDTLTVTGVADPVHGDVELAAGSITFTPDAEFCGTAGFDYTVSDGDLTDTGTVTVDVECVNDAPVAVDDASTAGQGGADVAIDVLANDTDIDGDTLEVSDAGPVSPTGAGTVAVGAGGGDVVYTPSVSFTGDATFEYTVTDGELTDTALVTVTVSPDDTAPVMTDLATAVGGGRVNQTAPVRISWAGTDDATGIASYQVQASVSGGAWSTIYTGTATSVRQYFAFRKDLAFQVRATDVAGNVGDWITLSSKVLAYQESSASVRFNPRGWSRWASHKHSGAAAMYTTTRGKSATLTFTGYAVAFVAPKTANSGHLKIYLDGTYAGRFDLSASRTRYGKIIFRTTLADGPHTIKIVSKSSKRISVDAFIVLQSRSTK